MKSYLKFLSRNKLYTAIEAVGLAVSLAFVILIGTYVVQQNEVAHESPDWKRTFVLGSDKNLGLSYWDKEELAMNIPEVQSVTHTAVMWEPKIKSGDDAFTGSGIETDADFFKVFPEYRIVDGSIDDFVGITDVLVSESLARRIAKGNENLVGGTIEVDGSELTIKGIFKDFDRNLFKPCDIIANISNSYGAKQEKNFYGIGAFATWFQVRPDADLEQVKAKIKSLLHKNYDLYWKAENVEKWKCYRMDEAFFHPGKSNNQIRVGDREMIRLLTVVVLLLLLSAIFNYVNLNLALIGKRSKEMATRRLLGADKGGILWNNILESVSFTTVCFAAAVMLAYVLTPMVNGLVSVGDGDAGVSLSLMMTPGYIAAYITGILLLGTICGLLPALVASRFEPIDVIKGTLRRHSKMVLSKVFIVAQNVLAVFMIAMALVLGAQMHHMVNRPTYSAVDNRFYIAVSARNYDTAKLLQDKVEAMPFVVNSGMGNGLPGHIFATLGIPVDLERRVDLPVILCDTAYFQIMGMKVMEDFGHPLSHSVWVSESAFKAADLADTSTVFPRRINFNGANPEYIGGIVHDFPTSEASKAEFNPNGAVIVTPPEEVQYAYNLLIETTGEDKSYEEQILEAYREYTLEQYGMERTPQKFGFIRNLNLKQLEPERKTLRLVELFAALSVLIALLGLLAMSTYFADENTKQIAVRKVFGADVSSETWRNVISYMILTGIACVIGIPLAVWAARLYLQRFAYRVENYGWVFVLAVIISLAIAFVSVLWQTLKAAKTNPAEELKKE